MKSRYILFVSLFFIACFNLLGQTDTNILPLQSLPPSPDAASLGKYGQYPVTMYNGLVNIDMPIYNIELPFINVPISISYHASGIQVNEISSVVGLGWSLNAGGVITRSVKGKPDALFGATGTIKSEAYVNLLGEAGKINFLLNCYKEELMGAYDSESDVYYYNFCGQSGSFRFDINGKLIQIPLTNNIISYDRNRSVFIITGNDGTVYTFENTEINENVGGGTPFYISSWYLTSITTRDNRNITFEYMTDPTRYIEYYESYHLSLPHVTDYTYNILPKFDRIRSRVVTTNTLLVDKIIFPGGTIFFSYTGDREDRRKYRLRSIKIKDEQSKDIKRVYFEHSYFSQFSYHPGNTNDQSKNYTNRLRLDKFTLDDPNNPLEYKFEYNTSKKLPPYYELGASNNNHNGQDLWGYYNGITSNKTLVSYDSGLSSPVLKDYPSADRSVNSECAQACVLQKIVFPTGGFTEFKYEGNKDGSSQPAGGLRIKNIISCNTQNDTAFVHTYEYKDVRDNGFGDHNGLRWKCYSQGVGVKAGSGSMGDLLRFYYYDYYLSEPTIPLSYSGGSPVFYKNVIEYQGTPSCSNGKTEYVFDYRTNDLKFKQLYYCVLPPTWLTFHPRFNYSYEDRSWTRGQPAMIKTYSKENGEFLLKKQTNHYYQEYFVEDYNVGFQSFQNIKVETLVYDNESQANSLFQYADILARTGLIKLTETIDSVFEGDNVFVYKTKYFYNNLNNQFEVSAVHQTNSDGSISKKIYEYPNDLKYDYSVCMDMSKLNILTSAIIVVDSLDDKLLKKTHTEYKTGSNGLINPYKINIQNRNYQSETEVIYKKYNDYGNILEIEKRDGAFITYFWGYGNKYPIMEIQNTSISEIKAAIPVTEYSLFDHMLQGNEYNESTIFYFDNMLRRYLLSSLIFTNLYKPLVGVKSQTDPRGITTYYEYDSSGRLKETYIIENNEKKILQAYDYHYQSE